MEERSFRFSCHLLRALLSLLKQYPDLLIYPDHRYQSPVQLGLPYIADTLETLELILAGKLTGTPVEVPLRIRSIGDNPWLSVTHKSSLGLIYNPDNL
ncbi:MAG: hypothetical protein LBG07_04240 [Treponema sp.]|jgi:hypothetical protein|nr:hypothetical protein [Treponema sp.]